MIYIRTDVSIFALNHVAVNELSEPEGAEVVIARVSHNARVATGGKWKVVFFTGDTVDASCGFQSREHAMALLDIVGAAEGVVDLRSAIISATRIGDSKIKSEAKRQAYANATESFTDKHGNPV